MSFVTVVPLLRMMRTQIPEEHELARSSLWGDPDVHVEFNVQCKLLWDKATKIWSRKPLCPTKLLQEHELPTTPSDLQDRDLQN